MLESKLFFCLPNPYIRDEDINGLLVQYSSEKVVGSERYECVRLQNRGYSGHISLFVKRYHTPVNKVSFANS